MRRDDLITRLKNLHPKLAAEGVEHLAIFGSRARGDESSGSDVDLLIDVKPETSFSLIDLIAVQHLVQDQIGIRANALMRRSLDDGFHGRIKDDVVDIF